MEERVSAILKIWEEHGIGFADHYATDMAAAITRGLALVDIEMYGTGLDDLSDEDYDYYDRVLEILREKNIGK